VLTDRADAGVADAAVEEPAGSRIAHVFVIAMENHDEGSIIGNSTLGSFHSVDGRLVLLA
jgi:hypothetical protein